MNVTILLAGTLVTIQEIRHALGKEHFDPPEEFAAEHSISFVDRGGFDVSLGGAPSGMSSERLLVSRPGLSLRFRHQDRFPDDVCTSVLFDEGAFLDALGRTRALPAVLPMTNRLASLRLRLIEATEAGDRLGAESVAGSLVEAAAEAADGEPVRRFGAAQLAWYARRIDRARERMDRGFAEPLSLSVLAREAGMSPFHFARVFRELEGIPPHRYLTGVRLRGAARLLSEGESVTAACFSAGFSNLSHFSRSFSRRYGVTPSRFSGSRRVPPEAGT